MSAITPLVKLEVVSEEDTTAPPTEAAQLLAPATWGAPEAASRPPITVALPRGEFEDFQDKGNSGNRKRGRPRKYEGLDEEERRKRRMCVSSRCMRAPAVRACM